MTNSQFFLLNFIAFQLATSLLVNYVEIFRKKLSLKFLTVLSFLKIARHLSLYLPPRLPFDPVNGTISATRGMSLGQFLSYFFVVGSATQLVSLPPHIPWIGQGVGNCCYVTLLLVLLDLPFFIINRRVRTDHLLFSQTHDFNANNFHQRYPMVGALEVKVHIIFSAFSDSWKDFFNIICRFEFFCCICVNLSP